MQKRIIPLREVATEEQISALIDEGWVCWGQVPVLIGQSVLTLGNPNPIQPQMAAVLVRPEPMVPMSQLAMAVARSRNLSELCQTLFRVPLEALRRQFGGTHADDAA